MVTKPLWRSVLYELAEVHKADAVLGLALSKIEELGHQVRKGGDKCSFFLKGEGGKKKDELATILLGFRLFNQALVQSVTKMASLSEQQLQEDLQKFKKMCGQSPNT